MVNVYSIQIDSPRKKYLPCVDYHKQSKFPYDCECFPPVGSVKDEECEVLEWCNDILHWKQIVSLGQF